MATTFNSKTGQSGQGSDTVSVTADGAIVVDTGKLLQKKHIRDTIQAIRDKTVVVNVHRSVESRSKFPSNK